MLADRPLPAASDGFFAGPRLPVDPMDATIIDERLAGFDLALVFCGLGLRLSGGIECLISVAAGERERGDREDDAEPHGRFPTH